MKPILPVETGREGWLADQIRTENQGLSLTQRADKYEKMAQSAFSFYRGSNHLFWADFSWDYRLNQFGNYQTQTWLNGDCHTDNFGAFRAHLGGDQFRVIYDINDFDEGVVADFQYDLWRLATSIVLVARGNELDSDAAKDGIAGLTSDYLKVLDGFRDQNNSRSVYYDKDSAYGKLDDFLEDAEDENSRVNMLEKWTTSASGSDRRFDLEGKPDKLAAVTDEERQAIFDHMGAYRETLDSDRKTDDAFFKVLDVARRINAGTGSLGVDRFYVLLDGHTISDDDDLILDVKEQVGPTALRYGNSFQQRLYREHFEDEGERQAVAYRSLAFHPDDFLGWMVFDGKAHSVRERSPYKETFDTEKLSSAKRLRKLAEQWGRGLATGHARGCVDLEFDFLNSVAKRTGGREDDFEALVWDIASGYADQVAADFATFGTLLAAGGGSELSL